MSIPASDALSPSGKTSRRSGPVAQSLEAYPIREYIGSMADELARLARFEGDEALAEILAAAALRAGVDPSIG